MHTSTSNCRVSGNLGKVVLMGTCTAWNVRIYVQYENISTAITESIELTYVRVSEPISQPLFQCSSVQYNSGLLGFFGSVVDMFDDNNNRLSSLKQLTQPLPQHINRDLTITNRFRESVSVCSVKLYCIDLT